MYKPTSTEDYLATLEPGPRAAIDKLRAVILAAAPEATPVISYGMPGFKDHTGRAVVCYCAFKDHYSLFPMGTSVFEVLGELLEPYRAGKGTIQFQYDERLPITLVKRLVKERLRENQRLHTKRSAARAKPSGDPARLRRRSRS